MVDEDEISLTTEFPIKVIQVQSPEESPSKPVLLQVSDLDTASPFFSVVFSLPWRYDGLQRRLRCLKSHGTTLMS